MTSKLTAAAETYESAIKVARDQGKVDIEKTAQGRLDALKPRIPMLAVRVARPPADLEVKLDGARLAPLLLDGKPFRVDPGEHTVTASASGWAPFSKTLRAEELSAPAIEIVLERSPGAAAPSKKPEPPGESKGYDEPPPGAPARRSRLVPIAATAGAIVFAGGGVVSFLLAGSAQSDAKSTCPTQKSCDSEQSKVRVLDTLALGGFIAGAGLGVLAIVAWSSSGTSAASAPRARVVATPSSVGVVGSF
jgi:hypothetical protein